MKKQQKTSLITIGVIAVCVVGLVILAKFGGTPNMTLEQATQYQFDVERFRGRINSPVVVAEYADFQCPACAGYAPLVDELVEKYGDRVAFIFRHFPLSGHDEAYVASTYAEAAHVQGRFFEFGNLLYAKQSEWASPSVRLVDKVREYAEYLGMNADQLIADAQKPEMRIAVDRGLSAGTVLDIPGTPTFFLNGERIATPRSVAEFSAVIDAALEKVSEESWSKEAVEEYASLAVFIRGKKVIVPSSFVSTSSADIVFADNKLGIVKKQVRGASLEDLFSGMGGSITDTCISISGESPVCAAEGESVKFFVNGLSRTGAASYVFRPGDRILLSLGPTIDSRTTSQVNAVPEVPCIYTNNCQK